MNLHDLHTFPRIGFLRPPQVHCAPPLIITEGTKTLTTCGGLVFWCVSPMGGCFTCDFHSCCLAGFQGSNIFLVWTWLKQYCVACAFRNTVKFMILNSRVFGWNRPAFHHGNLCNTCLSGHWASSTWDATSDLCKMLMAKILHQLGCIKFRWEWDELFL